MEIDLDKLWPDRSNQDGDSKLYGLPDDEARLLVHTTYTDESDAGRTLLKRSLDGKVNAAIKADNIGQARFWNDLRAECHICSEECAR